jgi:hypothetical protein
MVDHLGPDLAQPFNDPLPGPSDFLTGQIERSEHVGGVVDESQKEARLVGLESVATGLAPEVCVLAFLDPILYVAPFIVDFNYLGLGQPGIGHDKTVPGEEFS